MTTVDDWQVLVRDRNLRRLGVLVGADLSDLVFSPTASAVGVWSVTLPATVRAGTDGVTAPHLMCAALREPGAGIVVRFRGGTVFSGPMETATESVSAEAPDGLWEISGVSDEVVLEDATAWPDPAMGTAQAARYSNDVQSGRGSTLIESYVRRNIGSSAPASRRGLLASKLSTTGVPALGLTVMKSPRHQNLLELCAEIAAQSGVVFRVLDIDGVLQLRVFEGRDRTKAIRWTVTDGFLDSLTSDLGAPGVTRPIVAGQGEGEQRTLITPTTAESLAAESEWGRRTESFIDQRQTDDAAELLQKGLEAIATETTGVEVAPSPLSISGWPERWDLGDMVTVRTTSHGDLTFPVTEIPIRIGSNGVEVSAVLGNLTDDTTAERSTSSRVSNLERNGSSPFPSGMISPFGGVTAPPGWLICDGTAVSRSEYPLLFLTIGTNFGVGNGTTTFNLPDLRERAPVGQSVGSPEFGSLGAKAGAKTHTLTSGEIPAHSHSGTASSAGAHTHTVAGDQRFVTTDRSSDPGRRAAPAVTTGDYVPAWASTQAVSSELNTTSGGAHTHPVSTTNTGSGGAHNNLPPSLAVNYIVKA